MARLNDGELHQGLAAIADDVVKLEYERLLATQPYVPFPSIGIGGATITESPGEYAARLWMLAEQTVLVTRAVECREEMAARGRGEGPAAPARGRGGV